MKISTPNDMKLFFHHTIKQDLIKQIEPNYFNDYRDIANVFSIIKEFHTKYDAIPTADVINSKILEKGFDISSGVLNAILSTASYDETDAGYIKEKYRTWLSAELTKHQIVKMIDDSHSGKFSTELADQILNDEKEVTEVEVLRNTPIMPDSVYVNLPSILKDMLKNFHDKREKDILLTSEMVVLSSVFPTISGVYWFEECFSNLYAFIAAPAGSSKGVMKFAAHSLNEYKHKLKEEYDELKKHYDPKLKNEPPVERRHQIPANASSAAFVDSLANNEGVGLIFETEANTLTDNNKNEWGNYNTQLRTAFHHEPITLLRKESFVDIDKPKLSVLISGTLKQMTDLIVSSENGLFSRFIYYIFENDMCFMNPFEGINRTAYFKDYSKQISEMIDFYSQLNLTFKLNDDQGTRFTDFFNKNLTNLKTYYESGDIDGMVKRFGAITFRIMMLLSILRAYENRNQKIMFTTPLSLICSEQDFQVALEMITVYIKHSEFVFNNLIKNENMVVKGLNKRDLIDLMPELFKRSEIMRKAKELSISERSADRIIKKLIESGMLVKPDRFTYQKVVAAK